MRLRATKAEVAALANRHGWRLVDYQADIGMVSFVRGAGDDEVRVNVYLSKLTVSTALRHPKRGRTQLYRKHVSLRDLERIFERPRAHTGYGYYTKGGKRGEP